MKVQKGLKLFGLMLSILATILFCGFGKSQISNATPNNKFEKSLEQRLKVIISQPSISSNPSDYIKANQKVYNSLVKEGKPALKYFLKELELTKDDSLKTWIMAKVCCDILGKKNPVTKWSSGKEWFSKYQAQIK